MRKLLTLLLVLALPALVAGQESYARSVLQDFGPTATAQRCIQAEVGSQGSGRGATSGASTTVTTVGATGAFSVLAVGDRVTFTGGNDRQEGTIVTVTDTDNIVLAAAVTIPAAGYVWQFKPLDCTDGYFKVSGLGGFTIATDLEASDQALNFSIECRNSQGEAFQIHPDNSAGAAVATLASADAGTLEGRTAVYVPEPWADCRVPLLLAIAGTARVNVTLTGNRYSR